MAASMCRRLFTTGTSSLMRSLSLSWIRGSIGTSGAQSSVAATESKAFLTCRSSYLCNFNISRYITNYRPNTRYLIYKRDKYREAIARTVIRYDIQNARKQTVEEVPARFYRFANGLWLRAKAGRRRGMWKKSRARRLRGKQFVFCNKTQSKMLDGMVTKEYKTRKYYPDDPLQKFQDRNYCGLKIYPGEAFLKRHQKKFREPSMDSKGVADQIHESFGVNRYDHFKSKYKI